MCSTWNHNRAIQQESTVHPGGLKVKWLADSCWLPLWTRRLRDRTIPIGDLAVVDAFGKENDRWTQPPRTALSDDAPDFRGNRFAQFGVFLGIEMNTVDRTRDHDGAGIEKLHPGSGSVKRVLLWKPFRFFD